MTTTRQLVEAHYAAVDAGDLAGMLAPLSNEIVWIEGAGSPLAGAWVGLDVVADKVFGARQREWDSLSVAIDEFLEIGTTLVALGTSTGTFRATGRSFEMRVAQVWRAADGHVVRLEQIGDTAGILSAMS